MVASVPATLSEPDVSTALEARLREAIAELTDPANDGRAERLRSLVDSLRAQDLSVVRIMLSASASSILELLSSFVQWKEAAARDSVAARIEAQFARMQTPEARARMQAAFEATPEELGVAAVAAAKQRG